MIDFTQFSMYAWLNLCEALTARDAGRTADARVFFRVAKDFARQLAAHRARQDMRVAGEFEV